MALINESPPLIQKKVMMQRLIHDEDGVYSQSVLDIYHRQ